MTVSFNPYVCRDQASALLTNNVAESQNEQLAN